MSQPKESKGVAGLFSASHVRTDRWRTLHRLARELTTADKEQVAGLRKQAQDELAAMGPLEEFNAYPGPRLMAQVRDSLQAGDFTGLVRVVQRISASLLSNSYRDDPEAWTADDDGEAHTPDVLPPGIGRGQARKP